MEEKNSKIIKRNRVDEWSFFRNENGRICYSKQCLMCIHPYKQSFRAGIVFCNKYEHRS